VQKYVLVGMHDPFGKPYYGLWKHVSHFYTPHAIHINLPLMKRPQVIEKKLRQDIRNSQLLSVKSTLLFGELNGSDSVYTQHDEAVLSKHSLFVTNASAYDFLLKGA
jgi:hypothetical protein